MLKMALFDCAIDEKCCSVDGGRGICPLFSSPPGGFDSSRVPTPWPGICMRPCLDFVLVLLTKRL